jgi:uncharacterized protein (TIGR02145 family)
MLAVSAFLAVGCGGDDDDGGGGGGDGGGGGGGGNGGNNNATFVDSRDGKKYKKVTIGTQIWMAENLNYEVDSSGCQSDNPAKCEVYGRLYDWATALTACPSGWHLPSKDEWDILINYVGGEETAAAKLKAANGWRNKGDGSSGNGTDEFGFSALPGGNRTNDGEYWNISGCAGQWWSASEFNEVLVYFLPIYCGYDDLWWADGGKTWWKSVRCLQD